MFKGCVFAVESVLLSLCKSTIFYTVAARRFFTNGHKRTFNQAFPDSLHRLIPSLQTKFQSVFVRFYTLPTGPSIMKTNLINKGLIV